MASVATNISNTIKDGVLSYIENVRSGNVDVLDMFLVGWVVFAAVTILVTSWVTTILTKRRQAAIDSGKVQGGSPSRQKSMVAESSEWINSTIAWLYMHQSQSPEFVHSWIRALNDQAKKQGSSVQVTFDRVKTGSLPPKVTNVRSDAGPRDILTIRCHLEASSLSFVVFATQQTSASVKLSTCEVQVEKLSGEVQCKVACITEQIQVTAIFDGKPQLKLNVRPKSAATDDLVDMNIVENIIRGAITNAMTTYTLSAKNLPKEVTMTTNYNTTSSFQPVANMTRRPVVPTTQGIPPKPPRAHERRLLVKVIKANGLAGGNELACGNPYCLIEMDYPVQKHKTASVRNTANPFWDEHFLFDLNNSTNVIKFTVLDKDKSSQNQCLGGAIVSLESLRRNPSTRQIIPLQGNNIQDGNVSGSITLEFLFMEPAEAQVTANQMYPQPSPLRSKYPGTPTKNVETERTVTPTGTVITTVTTTTSRPKLSKDRKISGPSLNEAPSKITKADYNDQYNRRARSVSPARDRVTNSNELKPPDVNDGQLSAPNNDPSASRSRAPMKKSTLIIQGVSRDEDQSPVDESPSPSPSPTPTPTAVGSFRKTRGTANNSSSPNRSKRRFFSFGKKDKERDKRRHSSHSDLTDRSHTLPANQRDRLQVPVQKSARSSSAGDLQANHKGDTRSDTSSIRSTGSHLSYTPNDYSTLVIETLENGQVKHYLIPATLARNGKYEVRGTKLHVFNDHCFVATHFTSTVSCEACNKTLSRRMGKQGYQCRDCKIVVHKHCHFKVEAHCPNSRVSSMEMIRIAHS